MKQNNPGCCGCGYAGIVCSQCTNGDIPATLFLTDVNGTITLTWNAGLVAWVGCYTKTKTGEVFSGGTCTAASITGAIGYRLSCPAGTGRFRLQQFWSSCAIGTLPSAPGTCVAGQPVSGSGSTAVTGGGTFTSSVVVAPNCRPLSLTFTISTSNTNGTVTVSE